MGLKKKKINEVLKNFYYEEKYKYDPEAESNLKWNFSEKFFCMFFSVVSVTSVRERKRVNKGEQHVQKV